MLYSYQNGSLYPLSNLQEDDLAVINAHKTLYMQQSSNHQFVSFSVFTEEDERQKSASEDVSTDGAIDDTHTTFLVHVTLNASHTNRIYCRSYEELLRTLSMVFPVMAMLNIL